MTELEYTLANFTDAEIDAVADLGDKLLAEVKVNPYHHAFETGPRLIQAEIRYDKRESMHSAYSCRSSAQWMEKDVRNRPRHL
jgi:hypothetical protein